MVGGRVGAGITAEIGAMQVTEQIDAIRSMGADPVQKLVLPRVLAATLALPLLTILAVLLGLILGAGSANATMGFGVAVPVVLGSVALTMLEIFVAFLQAFIFTLLTTLFIGMSTVFHHDEHEEAAAH